MSQMTAVIIIYNKEVEKSITYNRLSKVKGVEVLIIDNSEEETDNAAFCRENSVSYISMKGNKGLSKAYNVAVEWCIDKQKDIIILFDDDTCVPTEYFDILSEYLYKCFDAEIFVPVIYGQDGRIYSPNRGRFLKNSLIGSTTEQIPQVKFNAISSCMAIRMSVFDGYRFNELLFVDQVDFVFCHDQRKRGKTFIRLPVSVQQRFHQREQNIASQAGWKRLQIRIIDIMKSAVLIGGKRFLIVGYVKGCLLGVQMARRTKDVSILFKAIKLSTYWFAYLLKRPAISGGNE